MVAGKRQFAVNRNMTRVRIRIVVYEIKWVYAYLSVGYKLLVIDSNP